MHHMYTWLLLFKQCLVYRSQKSVQKNVDLNHGHQGHRPLVQLDFGYKLRTYNNVNSFSFIQCTCTIDILGTRLEKMYDYILNLFYDVAMEDFTISHNDIV